MILIELGSIKNKEDLKERTKMTKDEFKSLLEKRGKNIFEFYNGNIKIDMSVFDLSNRDLSEINFFALKNEIGYNIDLSLSTITNTNLSKAYLPDVIFRDTDLTNTNLDCSQLYNANLHNANLTNATLKNAALQNVDLSCANLTGADLTGADLRGANLTGAKLINAKLDNILYNEETTFFHLQCPEEGAFIGYKKVWDISEYNYYIVKLLIPEDAKRSSATTRKCRCSKAKTLKIEKYIKCSNKYMYDVEEVTNPTSVLPATTYKVGEYTYPDSFDDDRWNECSNGIHFFITKQEAINY